jgi:hypothetical protein
MLASHPVVARIVSLGAAITLVMGVAGTIVAACYDVPAPDCGFRCGPDGACPDGYRCATDGVCHRSGAPANLVCATVDAAPPIDAPIDAIDAEIDAP